MSFDLCVTEVSLAGWLPHHKVAHNGVAHTPGREVEPPRRRRSNVLVAARQRRRTDLASSAPAMVRVFEPMPWNGRPHPLDAARLRHERSQECLREVEAAWLDFVVLHDRGSPVHGNALAYQDEDSGQWIPLPWYATAPLKVTFATSEMLYNLKVALDYATYALFKQALAQGVIAPAMFKSRRDLARLEKGVQFPIMDTPEKAQAWRREKGSWLGEPEWTVIERAQPYRRPTMHLLGDGYHNLDKHRDLQPLRVEVDLSRANFRRAALTTLGDDFEAESVPAGRPMAVYVRGAVEVFLDGRTPLRETLQVLVEEVGALIDDLSAAF